MENIKCEINTDLMGHDWFIIETPVKDLKKHLLENTYYSIFAFSLTPSFLYDLTLHEAITFLEYADRIKPGCCFKVRIIPENKRLYLVL